MAQQDLLLLQLLKVPVIVIKYLAKVLSILTYLPNYLFLLMVDHFLFSSQYQSTRARYILMWIPKLVLLVSSFCLFCAQFYGIFCVLQLQEHGLILQIVGMIFTLAGLLILMRKGYLSLIEKYNLSKLKSVKEHLELALYFGVDCICIIMTIINALLIVNFGKIWQFKYSGNGEYQYLKFIVRSVRESIIIYIQFVYVKIIFKLFPWRFNLQLETYKKEKDEHNVLNCLVLLTLTYIFTLVDISCILTFGIFNCIHYRRNLYFQALRSTPIKWKATLTHFAFASCQTLQLIVQLLMFPICWTQSKNCITMLLAYKEQKDLFGRQFKSLLIKCSIRLPYFICNALIALLVYKYKRRNMLVNQFRQNLQKITEKQFKQQNTLIVEYKTFQCFAQQFVDLFLVVPLLLAFLTKPWRIDLFRYCMSPDYKVNRLLIIGYLIRNLLEIVIFPVAIILNLLLLLYRFKKPYENCCQANAILEQRYKQIFLKKKGYNKLDFIGWPYFESGSWLAQMLAISWQTLKNDLPHLPLYFLLKITQLTIFRKGIQPNHAFKLIYQLYGEYYHLNVLASQKKQFYEGMNQRMKTNKQIINEQENTKFWKLAYKCQKLILVQKFICLFLSERSINRIKQKVKRGNNLSQFSNQYWYQYELMKAYILKLIFLIIQIIVSLIGFLFMLPLTLWRLPTFLKLYLHHKAKRYFFPILFAMYKQMLFDIILLPLRLIVAMIAPKMYLQFILRTSFQYGPAGYQSFTMYQETKRQYFLSAIFANNFFLMINALQILFIYLTWIRIKSLKYQLRKIQIKSVSLFFKQYIFKTPTVQTMQRIVQVIQNDPLNQRVYNIVHCINQVFHIALADLPYLLIIAVLFITMPWRMNYILEAIRNTRNDRDERKSFVQLLKNVFKDYLCIGLNIILLLSCFKTKKALLLIRRNYRLNFFIGFLQYSYYKQLIKQLISLLTIYKDVFYFTVACLFGWTRAHILVRELGDLRKKNKEEEQYAIQNKRIYQNTVKEEKELRLLNKMGFFNYINLCSYLTVPDIIALRQVDQLNYGLSKRQEIWFAKWQTVYSSKHNFIDQEFEARCKKAYIQENLANPRQVISYHSIIMVHFNKNVCQESVDIKEFTKERLPEKVYKYLFVDYAYSTGEGYGPENELPQQQNQDQQFLRLTNQIRRPKVQLNENVGYLNLLFFRPVEKVVQLMHRQFRVNSDRRKKQGVLILIVLFTIIFNLFILLNFLGSILWLQDRFIGIRLVILAYIGLFQYFMVIRASIMLLEWISLVPFDLYYDFVRGAKYLKDQIIKKRVVDPTTKVFERICASIKLVTNKVVDKVKIVGKKTSDFTIKYSMMAYEKVIKPLYLKIADIIRKVRDILVTVFKKVFNTLKTVLNAIYSLSVTIFKSIYNGIHAIFSNLNKLYYVILEKSMKFLLKFGLLGNLIFTIFGLILMTLPSIIWWYFYPERWYLIVSTIHTMVLIVTGYKNLNRIRSSA